MHLRRDAEAVRVTPAVMNLNSPWAELVRVTRADLTESVHFGAAVAVDGAGSILASVGDPHVPIFWRSTAKLHQALPLVSVGGAERLSLRDEHLAVICASHNGERWQTKRVSEILERVEVAPAQLKCGPHVPYGKEAAEELIRKGANPTPLHHMCSGNHAGLIALSRLLGAEVSSYDSLSSPAQQSLLEVVELYSGIPRGHIEFGVDGCGIPTYRTPLAALATAYARLAAPPEGFPEKLVRASQELFRAINRTPDMLSGPGELDAEFVRAFSGLAVCKLGAECLCAAALKPSDRWPNGVGIAMKIADGLGNRARPLVLREFVEALELGSPEQREAFRRHVQTEVRNNLGQQVGRLTAAFKLTVRKSSSA
jgi:L-asparaginase II